MPVPKRKRSHSRIAKSHANKGFETKSLSACQTCSAVIMPHQVCKECGHYKGIKVIKTKLERSMARGESRKAIAERAQARQGKSAVAETPEQA